MKKIINKLKSPVVWTEMVLIIAMILRLIGVYDMPNEVLTAIQDIITTLFTAFASLNNPDERKSF